jgi:hypothetical protein
MIFLEILIGLVAGAVATYVVLKKRYDDEKFFYIDNAAGLQQRYSEEMSLRIAEGEMYENKLEDNARHYNALVDVLNKKIAELEAIITPAEPTPVEPAVVEPGIVATLNSVVKKAKKKVKK